MRKRIVQWLLGLVVIAILIYTNRATILTTVVDIVGLSDPFVGVTTNGVVREGLFSIAASGATTDPMRRRQVIFLPVSARTSAAKRALT